MTTIDETTRPVSKIPFPSGELFTFLEVLVVTWAGDLKLFWLATSKIVFKNLATFE